MQDLYWVNFYYTLILEDDVRIDKAKKEIEKHEKAIQDRKDEIQDAKDCISAEKDLIRQIEITKRGRMKEFERHKGEAV